MPLDPANAAFLEQAATKPRKPLAETTVEELRTDMEALIPLGFEREEVAEVCDHEVSGVPVRTYLPGDGSGATVLWLHGGSFTRCGPTTHDTLYRRVANRAGVRVVAPDYSLAPEAQYPTQLDQATQVLRWVVDRWGADGGDAHVAGESSGGCLAAALALRARDGDAPAFDGLLLVTPVLDRDSGTASRHELDSGYMLTDEQLQWMFDQYAPGAAADDPFVHPFRAASLAGLPHTMVVTAEYDPLRDEAHEFAARVRAEGGTTDEYCVPGVTHHASLVAQVVPAGAEIIDRSAALLRAHARS